MESTTKPSSVKRKLNIDEILTHVGEYGTFQKLLNIIFGLIEIPYIFVIYIMTFAAQEPGWRCMENSTRCNLNGSFTSANELRCHIPRSEWEYTEPDSFSMIVTYDLYCEREWLVFLSTSIIFIGGLVGAVILAWVSDNYGRKKLLFATFGLGHITNCLSAFMPNITLFIIMRFLTGFLMAGVNSFIMMSEIVGGKYRAPSGNFMWLFYTAGLCLLPLKAYLIDSWKMLFLAGSVPYLVILFSYKFVPESIRWLRLKGRVDEAMKILRRIAKRNGKSISPDISLSVPPVSKTMTSPIDIFKTKYNALISIVLMFAFYVNAMVYFGLSLAADDIGVGSIYSSFVLVSLVEFPADILAIVLCNRFGRKKATTLPLALAGVLTLLIPAMPSTWTLRVVVGMLGKMFMTVSYNSISIWAIEIYTTNIRAEAFSIMKVASTIGGASAPWIAKGLKRVSPNLPFYIMGSLGFLAGVTCLVLPETNGIELKESEVEQLNKDDSAKPVA